jgi:hypothetical protein
MSGISMRFGILALASPMAFWMSCCRPAESSPLAAAVEQLA